MGRKGTSKVGGSIVFRSWSLNAKVFPYKRMPWEKWKEKGQAWREGSADVLLGCVQKRFYCTGMRRLAGGVHKCSGQCEGAIR